MEGGLVSLGLMELWERNRSKISRNGDFLWDDGFKSDVLGEFDNYMKWLCESEYELIGVCPENEIMNGNLAASFIGNSEDLRPRHLQSTSQSSW